MTRVSVAAAFAAIVVSASAHAEVTYDKYLHFGASAVIASGVTTLTAESPNRLWYGLGAGLAVGVAKEIADSKQAHNRFDAKDLWADVAGTLAGAYLAHSLLRPVVLRQPRGYALGMQMNMPLK